METLRAALVTGSLSAFTCELEILCFWPLSRSMTLTCASHNEVAESLQMHVFKDFIPLKQAICLVSFGMALL